VVRLAGRKKKLTVTKCSFLNYFFQLKKPLSTHSIPSQQPHQAGGGEATALARPRFHGQTSLTASASGDASKEQQGDQAANESDDMTKKGGSIGEGDASIALVGVRSEFPKYGDEKGVPGKERGGSNVGYR
jgi:hypothetical protein